MLANLPKKKQKKKTKANSQYFKIPAVGTRGNRVESEQSQIE